MTLDKWYMICLIFLSNLCRFSGITEKILEVISKVGSVSRIRRIKAIYQKVLLVSEFK